MNHEENIKNAFNVEENELCEMLEDVNQNGKVLLVQEQNPNFQEIHYVLNSKSKFKQYAPVKLLKEVRYFYHNYNYAICNEEDVEKTTLPAKPVKKKQKVTPEMTTKIMNAAARLYQLHPEFFIPAFKQLKSDTVLNFKMKERYPEHADRKYMYKAIAFVEKLVSVGDAWKVATIKSSNHYNVPYKSLESLIQIKMANRKI